MRIIILSPIAQNLFTEKQKSKLKSAAEVIYVSKIRKFEDIEELHSVGPKILAIDPDFCDWKISNSAIDKIKNLKTICLQTTSFSWIDIEHCKTKGIPVTNLIGFSSEAVAEWAMMIAMALARKIPLVIKDGWKGDYSKHQGIELKNKVAGIIGLGRNGTSLAELCNGLGMKVIYWSKNSRNKNFEYVELQELMKSSDFIFPTFAQNAETGKLLNDKIMKTMKKSAIFISTIGHKTYNHQLLLDMVKNRTLGGYGFELSPSEFKDFKDFEGNIWAGPDLAWATEDSMRKNADLWCDAIYNATIGKYPTRVD